MKNELKKKNRIFSKFELDMGSINNDGNKYFSNPKKKYMKIDSLTFFIFVKQKIATENICSVSNKKSYK